MKNIILKLALVLTTMSLICCNTKTETSSNDPIKDEIEATKKELQGVFVKMWDNVTLSKASEYFKTDVSDTFFTINADGIVQNKAEVLADSKRLEMLEILNFKFFDQQIKVFEKVGIITGRIEAFSDEAYVGEVFYTAIFVKYGDTWKYENWQGTWSKDSPPPPAFIEEK